MNKEQATIDRFYKIMGGKNMKFFKDKYFAKIVASILMLAVVFAISASPVAYASSDENIDYSFKVKINYAVTRFGESKYRSTSDNNNSWKVNLRTSEEGTNTVTLFSLGLEDYTAASTWYAVTVGSGSHYFPTNDAADFNRVYLQAKDNSNKSATYQITGFWDEETGVTPD